MKDKVVATNRKALFKYKVLSRIEAGIVLRGSEVKSLRSGHVGFEDSYAVIRNDEIYLRSLHIAGYDKAHGGGHDPVAERKLLMKRHEIRRLEQKVLQKGVTLIPMNVYFKNGWAKVEIGLCVGKIKYDKRRAIMEREQKIEDARFNKIKRGWTG